MTDDRATEAAARRQAAEERAQELSELRQRLAQGQPLSPADVELADRRRNDALDRADHAHDNAVTAHERAAERHREAAAVAERAGHTEVAEHHRDAAASDDASARLERDKRERPHDLRKRATE